MKNYLVITLGTREIQLPVNKIEENSFEVIEEKGERFSKFFVQRINDSSIRFEVRQPSKEFPDYYTISPRTTGKVIDEYYALFQPIIDFPIIRPAIEYLKQKNVSLDVIMLVYTDQEEAFKSGRVKFQNKENDSVYYADIISKLIKEDSFFINTEIDQFAITDNVTDLGYQYDDFKRINHLLLYSEQVKQVFLYPQGGIDQINQALILRLIETFKGKVKQLQKAEGVDFKELDFPSKFLSSLNKQKILKHLADYDFGLIDSELTDNPIIKHISTYTKNRLELKHDSLKNSFDNLIGRSEISNQLKNILQIPTSKNEKLKDLYLSAKISCHQKKYGDFLWRIFTLNENLFRIKVEKFLDTRTEKYRNVALGQSDLNQAWIDKLNRVNPTIVEKLKEKGIWLNNPSRKAFYVILQVLDPTSSDYQKIGDKLELLSEKRNKLAHGLEAVDRYQINLILGIEYKIEGLLSDLDKIFDVQGFGIYDVIRKEIEDLL
ncbi:hypothetical protein VB796_21255 [Arcicella sp. LKC2W]|uniref:hypothetical protein n=1 Tax=Arcicella sp. LKC2W TaxID=2984198 RepID=UPI002B21CAC2|nr:hypothetical protein [Arcicella sp. LKC2W]MEA5461609.1 hypothetical protein [Arcicella sp. LKC2W]